MHAHRTVEESADEVAAPVSSAIGRAWGKVILLGEHAVVYGVPALAIGIDRGAHASLTPAAGKRCVLEVAAWDVAVHEGDTSTDLARAFSAIVAASRALAGAVVHRTAVRVAARTDLPPGGGLGCSAALGVAVARALVPTAEARQAAELAMAWERVFHGNPSGIDAAISASGGCILFEKGREMQAVGVGAPLTVCLGSSGVTSSTKTMVDGVSRLREQRRPMVDEAFLGIASLVGIARLAIESGDIALLGDLMDQNQRILRGLGLSTDVIERLCGVARDAGALGAKLTGAGGGGCVVALASGAVDADRVLSAWSAAGFGGFTAVVAATKGGAR